MTLAPLTIMFVFNCSHEMALAANRRNYSPPRSIQQMEHDLALLPLVWQEDEDAEIEVWGWNLAVREQLRKQGVPMSKMPTDEELAQWRMFSHRAFAADYLQEFLSQCDTDYVVGHNMRFVHTMDELTLPDDVKIMAKIPFSSSGRGNFVGYLHEKRFRQQVETLMEKHGGVLVDRFYKKILDFALEYEVKPDGMVFFLGYSVFEASAEGRYGGNVVDYQPNMKARINETLEHDVTFIAELHRQMLQQKLAGRYRGYVGIDMMVVDGDGRDVHKRKVHPCVEMNFRMNMGIAAIRLYEKLLLLSRLVAEGFTYDQCCQRKNFGFLGYLSETDFNRFHFEDLSHLLRSSMRLPLSPIRDCGFQAFLQSGRLSITFS